MLHWVLRWHRTAALTSVQRVIELARTIRERHNVSVKRPVRAFGSTAAAAAEWRKLQTLSCSMCPCSCLPLLLPAYICPPALAPHPPAQLVDAHVPACWTYICPPAGAGGGCGAPRPGLPGRPDR